MCTTGRSASSGLVAGGVLALQGADARGLPVLGLAPGGLQQAVGIAVMVSRVASGIKRVAADGDIVAVDDQYGTGRIAPMAAASPGNNGNKIDNQYAVSVTNWGPELIDAGNNQTCPPTDQRGVPRPQDGDGDGTAICDIGAVERSADAPPPPTPTPGGPGAIYLPWGSR